MSEQPPPRRPSPSAQAASRARRIGGRPSPGPRPGPGTDTDSAPVTVAPEATRRGRGPAVEITKKGSDATKQGAAPRGPEDRTQDLQRRLTRLRWIPAAVAAVVVVALLATVVVLSHGVWWAKKTAPDRRGEVLAAAKTCVAAVSSYDYRALARSEAAGLACATGQFKTDYAQAMKTVVSTLAPQAKTIQTLSVTKAGVVSVSADAQQWVILIYGQQKVQNNTTAKAQPRYDIVSLQITMNNVGGKWLIETDKLAN